MTNTSITGAIRPQVLELDRFVALPDVTQALRQAAKQVMAQLAASAEEAATVVTVPLASLGAAPPSFIQTLRMAAFRPGLEMERERHPNSDQFLHCLTGTGETRVLRDGQWQADSYGQDRHATFENRWHATPAGMWHQSVATGKKPLALAAFHTAKDVQDEYAVRMCGP